LKPEYNAPVRKPNKIYAFSKHQPVGGNGEPVPFIYRIYYIHTGNGLTYGSSAKSDGAHQKLA
jgi:hypothetical protein